MTKRKSTGKATGAAGTGTKKKATTGKTSAAKPKKEMNAAEVRKDIARIVGAGAIEIAEAVMSDAMKGQLAPAKFLLELAGVYPPQTDGSEATDEEDCLAKTLLERLHIPTEPIKLDEDEELVVVPAGDGPSTAPGDDGVSGK